MLSLRDRFLIARDALKGLVFEARKAPADSECGEWIRGGVRAARAEYRACLRMYRSERIRTSAPACPWRPK